jgi:uncharacterized integral membrane protein
VADWIYDLPIKTLAIWVAVIFVGYCWLGGTLLRPILRPFVRSRESGNEIVGYVLSSFGVFYGLLLGLIAVAAYQNFTRVESNIVQEVSSLETLYEGVSTFPEPHGQNLSWLLRDYCRWVIKYGWPEYKSGKIPEQGATKLKAFQERMLAFEPGSKTEELIFAQTLHQFNVFLDKQRVREQSVTTGIPPIMWFVVIVGAILNIALFWLFDIRYVTMLFLGGVLSFFLGVMILLIAVMDNPFRGAVSISSEPFEQLYWQRMRD